MPSDISYLSGIAVLDENLPVGLRPPADAPQDRQFAAWGHDVHGLGHGREDEKPRWWLVHWGSDVQAKPGEDRGYWRTSTPGHSTRIRIIGWMPLPWTDHVAAAGMAKAQGVPFDPEQNY